MKNDDQTGPFAIVPVEVMMDTRLTLETMRVLVTLFSFRNKLTGLAFPSRQAISERCGMHPSNISDATSKLVQLGWLIKNGVGGHSKATRYLICMPDIFNKQTERTVAEQTTVAESTTVAAPTTPPLADSATTPLAGATTRKEQTNITNHLTENTPAKKTAGEKLLTGIDPQIVSDFLLIRKTKKSPLTQTALNGIQREANIAGLSLEEALKICCERDWRGFKAEWLRNISGSFVDRKETQKLQNQAALEAWANGGVSENIIEGEFKHA